ncbi:MAG: phosphoglycerate mutase family protein [Tetragenococcus koreensis]|nr:phosphoglycerate mutase family protein [Tetragenococcus koreensis]MDN6270110.1 phosphoglycerate mutase family protein [Tetragenococcus koreensis]MDN6496789.1 phosphoglycerate mutase family protein [Tetragenococcus koreensis]MDN6540923.1 phosphoglycerate mutase family protein [Tetragenococcus koreensis]
MRHGQTLFNQLHKIQGWCDAPLTKTGFEQAQIAAEYFKQNNIQIESAYCSTSERTSDTLEQITNLPYTRLKGLKEWNFGVFEGEPEFLNPSLPYGDFFVPYGGESEMDLKKRVAETVMDFMKKEPNDTVLAVSHGASCRQFMRYWSHTSEVEQKSKLRECCILKFEFENNQFKLVDIINHDFSSIE